MTNCVKTLCKNKKTNRSVIKIPLSPEDKKIFENVWKDLDVDTLGAHHMNDCIFLVNHGILEIHKLTKVLIL